MNFRDLARTKVSSLILRLTQSSGKSLQEKQITALTDELFSEPLSPVIDFVLEYHGNVECFYGYLFEPYKETASLSPLLQKSKNKRSPYYCLKVPVRNLGNIFLIPLSITSTSKYALILKPDRVYRQDIKIDNAVFLASGTSTLYPPYPGLIESLLNWAVMREVFERNRK